MLIHLGVAIEPASSSDRSTRWPQAIRFNCTMDIRDALTEDVRSIAEVYLASVLASYSEIATENYLATRNLSGCISQWTRNVRDDSMTVVVVEESGAIQGVASFSMARDEDVDTTTTAEIQAIYVSPDRWGNGLGRQLCRHAMKRVYSGGLHSILLWVLADNVHASRFYKRVGFKPDGASKFVTMGRELKADRYIHSRLTGT